MKSLRRTSTKSPGDRRGKLVWSVTKENDGVDDWIFLKFKRDDKVEWGTGQLVDDFGDTLEWLNREYRNLTGGP